MIFAGCTALGLFYRTRYYEEEPFRCTLLSAGKLLQKEDGRDFSACWEEAFAVLLQKLPLTKEEKESFLSFAKVKGLKDWQMQVRVMEGHRDTIKEARRIREQNVLQLGKLATARGVLGGLLLVFVVL